MPLYTRVPSDKAVARRQELITLLRQKTGMTEEDLKDFYAKLETQVVMSFYNTGMPNPMSQEHFSFEVDSVAWEAIMDETPFPFQDQQPPDDSWLQRPWSASYGATLGELMAEEACETLDLIGSNGHNFLGYPMVGEYPTHWGTKFDFIRGLHLRAKQEGRLLLYIARNNTAAHLAANHLQQRDIDAKFDKSYQTSPDKVSILVAKNLEDLIDELKDLSRQQKVTVVVDVGTVSRDDVLSEVLKIQGMCCPKEAESILLKDLKRGTKETDTTIRVVAPFFDGVKSGSSE